MVIVMSNHNDEYPQKIILNLNLKEMILFDYKVYYFTCTDLIRCVYENETNSPKDINIGWIISICWINTRYYSNLGLDIGHAFCI